MTVSAEELDAWGERLLAALEERMNESKELGRELIEERAKNLTLQRRLFEVRERLEALEGPNEFVSPSELVDTYSQPLVASLDNIRKWVSEAKTLVASLENSRVLKGVRLISRRPLAIAERIEALLQQIDRQLARIIQSSLVR